MTMIITNEKNGSTSNSCRRHELPAGTVWTKHIHTLHHDLNTKILFSFAQVNLRRKRWSRSLWEATRSNCA